MKRAIVAISLLSLAGFAHSEPLGLGAKMTLSQMVEAAQIYLKLPEREVLSQEELRPLLDFWDEMTQSNYIPDRYEALDLIGDWPYLCYDNQELKDRLASLFISEKEALSQRVHDGIVSWGDAGLIAPGESYQDYMDGLETLAYETFSPQIYDTALDGYGGGGFRRKVYLVAIDPANTLTLLLETQRRNTEFASLGAAWLDHPTERVHFGAVDDGLLVLALLCELCPEVVALDRDRALAFVREHGTFYREPIKRSPHRPEPKHLNVLDLRTRDRALRILELLAGPEDIPLVEDIMRDPPLSPKQIREGLTTSDTTIRGAQLLRSLEKMN